MWLNPKVVRSRYLTTIIPQTPNYKQIVGNGKLKIDWKLLSTSFNLSSAGTVHGQYQMDCKIEAHYCIFLSLT